jgi:hypothetical protein
MHVTMEFTHIKLNVVLLTTTENNLTKRNIYKGKDDLKNGTE